jgi:hypothetical protein
MENLPEWRVREIEADIVNRSLAVNGIYKWKCDQCGLEWEEPANVCDFINAAGEFVERKDIPYWGVLCDKCNDKFIQKLKQERQ